MAQRAYGQPVSVTDANGNITSYIYDAQGNLTEVKEPLGRTIKFTYDGVGRKISETDANGNLTAYIYDYNNNLLSTTNALGQKVSFQYDANGNKIAETDENNNTTRYVYDARNRLTSVIDSLDNQTRYAYDALYHAGLNLDVYRRKVTDANNKVTEYLYDANGNLRMATDAAGGTVVYAYDENGNRLSVKDPKGNTTNLAYDALNRLTSKIEPLGNKHQYFYDVVGNLSSVTDPKNNTIGYTYDQMNRLVRMTFPDTSTISYAYDANGNRTQMTDSLGTSAYQYDALNRLVSYTNPFAMTVGYGYDVNNNRASIVYPSSKTVSYGYDALNRLTTVTDWLNKTASYTYDTTSRLTTVTNPNGSMVAYAYDKANRLTSLINKKSDDTVISNYSYVLDNIGNQMSVTQTEPILPVIAAKNIAYSYDVENRILNAGGTGLMHDANGNLIKRGVDTFIYDYRDKLTQSVIGGVTEQYGYDGAGNRLSKTSGGLTKRYVQDINSSLPNVIAETDGSGNITAYYVYGIGLVSKVLPDGTAYYYHFDSRGSTVALTDSAQSVTDAYAYDPFGKVLNSTGSTPNPFKYVGGYGLMDDGNGLTYVRARYYSPELGRFVTKDLLTGNDADGQSMNRYIYTLNNPVGMVDVSGFESEELMKKNDAMYNIFLTASKEFSKATNWKVVSVKGHIRSGKWVPARARRAPNTVKSGAVHIGVLVGPAIQAAQDFGRNDLSGGQRIGRYSFSVLEAAVPGLGVVDLGASLVFGHDKVDQVKADFFSSKNPIVDTSADLLRKFGGGRVDRWLLRQEWLDLF